MLVYATGLAVVDIRGESLDGKHLVIPVPLALADVALAFVDQKHKRIECPEFGQHREAATRLARELRRTPDARLVEVESPGEHVTIDKAGDMLLVEVHDDGDEVRVRVPVAALEALVNSYDGRGFQASDVIAAVRKAPSGELVQVHDGNDHVRIWIW
jgi:hypothetical protein